MRTTTAASSPSSSTSGLSYPRAEPPSAGCSLRHRYTPADPMSADTGGWDGDHMQTLIATPPNTAVVSATDVARRYGSGDTSVDALRGVSIEIARGRLTAVMGPSGSGKSTLMHLLAGLGRPTAGGVWIDGANITALGESDLTRLRRRHIGFVFQFFNLLPMLTA